MSQSLSIYVDTPGPYSRLLQDRDLGTSVSKDALQQAASTILSNGLTDPFIYRVAQQEDDRNVGYLIGTSHYCNEQMVTNPAFQIILTPSRCSRLFTEKLPPWYASTPPEALVGTICARPFSNQLIAQMGMRIAMDNTLCALARSQNIDCQALETEEESQQRIAALNRVVKHNILWDQQFHYLGDDSSKTSFQWYISRTEEERSLEIMEYYQRGCAKQLHRFMETTPQQDLQEAIFKTNVLWTQRSIIPALRQQKDGKSICVMVGVNHLLGAPSAPEQTSIIKLLREQGFKVARLAIQISTQPIAAPAMSPPSIQEMPADQQAQLSPKNPQHNCDIKFAILLSSFLVLGAITAMISRRLNLQL